LETLVGDINFHLSSFLGEVSAYQEGKFRIKFVKG